MLQNKDIAKVQEIKTFFNDSWTQAEFFSNQLSLFKFSKTTKFFTSIKKHGISAWDILSVLFVMPFTNTPTINSLFTTKMAIDSEGKKDSYYRLLENKNINWRLLLLLFVKRYLNLENKFSNSTDTPRCLIFDDTEIKKSGKKIEGVSKIHSHVSQSFIFGYKLLVAGYWNGTVFIPVDFSFHRESKNNKTKKYGLTKKQYKAQKKQNRSVGTSVYKRFKELNIKKNELIIDMYKRINQRKINVDYILMDSWFTTVSLIEKLLKINGDVQVIGMYKYNSKIEIDGKERTIKQLRKSKNGLKRSRKTGFYYMTFIGNIDGVTLKFFLSRRGKKGAWHTIVSTDTSLSFNKMVEIYNIRWTIEIFFKEAKQLLGLGKCQSTNFDVQIAQTTITMIQYLLMSIKYRMEAYETINGLFKDLKQDYIEHKLNERLFALILELLMFLESIGVDCEIEITISKLIAYSEKFVFLRSYQIPENHQKSAA
jgi:hypothetical protein